MADADDAAPERSPKRRRGHGEGSFHERKNGLWEFKFTLPDGRRRSVYGKTKAEVRSKAKDLQRRVDEGLALTKDQTVEQFLASWMRDVKKPEIAPTTWANHERAIRLYINPKIGRIKLLRLTPQHLQALYSDMLEAEKGPATVRRVHAILHGALEQAVRWNLIGRNLADAVTPPRIAHREMQTLSRGDVQRLLDAAHSPVYRALYALAATAGLRRGEIQALMWSDIDFDRRTVSVQRSLQYVAGEGVRFSEPKTARSRRLVLLSQLATAELRVLKTAQIEMRLKAGPAWEETGLVFTTAVGAALDGGNLTDRFHRDLAAAGLPKVRLHDLRHTAATLMLQAGVPAKIVAETLGHSSVRVTLDVYSHVTPHMQEQAAAAMDRLFGYA